MIFGNRKTVPMTLACLFFGIAKPGGLQLCITEQLPSKYIDLFLLLIFFITQNRPPKAARRNIGQKRPTKRASPLQS